ncbi:MAG: hypothetical protein CMLOHMNK_00515 [Steroidobacteraceae bacterium]|nr:hypothetical protein [Steroidobacteraceae bacterium]
MASHVLIDAFLQPTSEPETPHEVAGDVVAFRVSADRCVVQEVYRRPNKLLGFRYFAWVAWRDAGEQVRSHGWFKVEPEHALVADSTAVAQQAAAEHANSKGLQLPASWKAHA